MKKHKIKINLNNILIYVVLLSSTVPYGIKVFVGERLYELFISYGCIISFFCSLIVSKKVKIKLEEYKATITIIITRLFMLFSSVIRQNNKAAISANIKYLIIIFSFCYLCESLLHDGKVELFIRDSINLYSLYFSINLFLMIKYPSGINSVSVFTTDLQAYRFIDYHFIGFRNHFGFLMFPILSFVLFDLFLNKKKHIFLQIIIVTSSILSMSSTTILSVASFYLCIMLVFAIKRLNTRLFSNKTIFFIYFVFVFIIVILNSAVGFRSFIASFFGKSASLSGRTTIWKYAIEKIISKPILGYGNENIIFMNGYYWYAHNGVLDLLIQGGIVLLILYSLSLSMCYKGLKCAVEDELYLYSLPITTMYCVLMLTESIINYSILFYPVLVIFNHSKELRLLKIPATTIR